MFKRRFTCFPVHLPLPSFLPSPLLISSFPLFILFLPSLLSSPPAFLSFLEHHYFLSLAIGKKAGLIKKNIPRRFKLPVSLCSLLFYSVIRLFIHCTNTCLSASKQPPIGKYWYLQYIVLFMTFVPFG